ncbi:hypothetical protein [Herbiconiux liangxiaofengii]|uniref:hypothetical protein n=1 Tax=Herbiconiux liangxiaofengii TaxID=3342795 RepID=UPI0035BB22E1
MPTTPPTGERPRWTSAQYSYLALGLNALCLIVLFGNALSANRWWQIAVPVAVGFIVLGGLSGIQARRLRTKERRKGL